MSRSGTSFLGLSRASEKLGLKTFGLSLTFDSLSKEMQLPCIVHWKQKHFIVVYKVTKKTVFVSDPSHGLIQYPISEFLDGWQSEKRVARGVALFFEPTVSFQSESSKEEPKVSLFFLWKYLVKYKQLLLQLCFSVLAVTAIQLAFPFLTQALVDHGIQDQNFNFVFLVLAAQLMLFLSRTSLEVIRSWILMHIGTRLQISLLSDFFIKLMKLPISFFDQRATGDILQRVNDQKRIEGFLTVTSLNSIFSAVNLIVFGAVLWFYSFLIFLIYALGAAAFFLWVLLFQKKRADLDFKLFSEQSEEQKKVIELVDGMQELKLNNAEREKRAGWEHIQSKLFKIEVKTLSLEQVQVVGASFINELKNILITILAAKLVIEGQLTLGMMLAISFIIGQLNGPILQIIDFLHSSQKAQLSLQRLVDVQTHADEERSEENLVSEVDENQGINFRNVSFKYNGSEQAVFTNLNIELSANKITAFVGESGAGKTTLLKLLLKIYSPDSGKITIGSEDLRNVSPSYWRRHCGVVMQDGFIFNDTIARNIAMGDGLIDNDRLRTAIQVSNVKEFSDDLPLGLNTVIGSDGRGLSVGQKQRILIARAVYKNPKFIFFDEATSSLDAENEKSIMDNLRAFFKGRTVAIIAHRLSTIRNADLIVVLGARGVIESGTHEHLIKSKGHYYRLVKNQFEIQVDDSCEELIGVSNSNGRVL